MQIQEALQKGRHYLKNRNISSPALDAQVLLSAVTGLDRTELVLKGDQPLLPEQQERYQRLLERRAVGEPVAYLTGHKEFMGLDFKVTPSVLIPRPDTELLVETARELLDRSKGRPVAVDVGTGSGAIAVSLAVLLPNLQVHAVDISAPALVVARENAQRHRVAERVRFHLGSLLEPLAPELKGGVSLIAANLPYIPAGDMAGLMTDVKDFEPKLALDGGPDGLDLYRELVPQAYRYLHPGGSLLMEIGPGQGEGACLLLPEDRWSARVKADLAGRERLVVAEKR